MEEKDFHCKPTDVNSSTLSSNFQSSRKNILIIRPGALGDVIVTLPTFGALRNYFQGANIEIMGYSSPLEIVKGRFYADAVSRFDQAEIATLFIKNARISESLMKRFGNIDMIISFVRDKEQVLMKNLKATGVRCVIPYEPFPSDGEHIHIIDHFLKFLDLLSIPHTKRIPKIFLRNEDILFGNDFLKDKLVDPQKILVAVHPGSGSRQKCWPIDRFAELILRLKEEIHAQILIISGPADDEIIERLRAKIEHTFILADQLPLPILATIIKQCNLFIGNDSGITHLAAAVGTYTIAIFGPTDPNVWGPRGELVKILYRKSHCSPCLSDKRKDCFLQTCLENVTVEDVILEIRHICKCL